MPPKKLKHERRSLLNTHGKQSAKLSILKAGFYFVMVEMKLKFFSTNEQLRSSLLLSNYDINISFALDSLLHFGFALQSVIQKFHFLNKQ